MRLKDLLNVFISTADIEINQVKIKKATYGQIVKVVVHFCHLSHLQLKGGNREK